MSSFKQKIKSGFVTILGRPNVGKSTLLNTLVNEKVSIVSNIPQTTRYQIKGILNLKNAQIVFVDTPGIHLFKDKLALHLNTIAKQALEGCDLIIYVVDSVRPPGEEEKQLLDVVNRQKVKTIMVLNKIDLGDKFLNDYIKSCKADYYIPLSAKTGKNIDELEKALIENLPYSQPYYDKDCISDFPSKFRIADMVREKLFLSLKKELPHSLAVEVSRIQNKAKVVYIKVTIYVERDSQKKIVVGKGGLILKKVGSLARPEIEKIYNKKVYLDIWITVLKDWKKRPRILKELGYLDGA